MAPEQIEKFIRHELSEAETEQLLAWIKEDEEHREILKTALAIDYLLDSDAKQHEFNADSGYAEIEEFLQSPRKKRINKRRFLKYAAIFIALMALGGIFFTQFHNAEEQPAETTDQITLELENGEIEPINGVNSKPILNQNKQVIGFQMDDVLNYRNTAPQTQLTYNTLKLPYGKRFQVILSDGTQIMLNAGSQLKYPIHFLPDQKREVFLEGEGYFKVATDSTRQFIVHTEQQDVAVYGTEFNVSAYKDDRNTQTVLVSGSVGVTSKGKKIILSPGEMASTSKGALSAIKVDRVNPTQYISWKTGQLIFKSRPFSEILKILERQYNVSITNHYKALNNQAFTANLKGKSIEQILDLFSKSRPFHYSITGNKIVISKNK